MRRYPGIPSILDTVLRNATGYFVLMFSCQLVYEVLTFSTRVSGIPYIWGCAHQAYV